MPFLFCMKFHIFCYIWDSPAMIRNEKKRFFRDFGYMRQRISQGDHLKFFFFVDKKVIKRF